MPVSAVQADEVPYFSLIVVTGDSLNGTRSRDGEGGRRADDAGVEHLAESVRSSLSGSDLGRRTG